MDPRFYSEGDESAGQHPSTPVSPSFSAKAGNPERQSVKHGPPLCSEGDEGEWARLTKVQGKHPSLSVIFAKAEIQKDN